MPAVRWFPRDAGFMHFYRSFERFSLKNSSKVMLKAMSALALYHKRMKSADSNSCRRSIMLALAACGMSHVQRKRFHSRKRITGFFSLQGMQDLNEDEFEEMFRFH
jgi:hypothetical protein